MIMNTNVLLQANPENEKLDFEVNSTRILMDMGDYYSYYLKTVQYIKNDKIIWNKELPKWIQQKEIERSFEKPINVKELHGFPFLKTILENKFINLANEKGIVIYEKSSGEISLDKQIKSGNEFFFIDTGTAKIRNSNIHCEEKLHGIKLFKKCGDKIFYFYGTSLIVLNLEGELFKETLYNSKYNIPLKKKLEYKVIFKPEEFELEITGTVFVR